MTLIELRNKQKNILTLARQKMDEITAETTEARAKEIETEHDAAMVDYDVIGEKVKRAERLAEAEARSTEELRSRRPLGENSEARGVSDGAEKLDEKQVFRKLLRVGVAGLTPEERSFSDQLTANLAPEQRALAVGTGAAGGFTVPQEFSGEIEKSLLAWGPMLDPAVTRVITTDSGNLIPWPTMNDTANVGRLITENSAAADLDVSFGNINLSSFMYTSDMVKVPYQLLMDSGFNIDTEVIEPAFGERIGRKTNEHLTVGTGVAQPTGIVTGSGLGKTTAAVAAVTADEILDFYHSIDPAYRASPKFKMMFNDSTLLAVRKLKDTQQRYLIDGLKDGGSTLNLAGVSVPYVINQAVASMATGARFMVAGDFSKYVVRKVRDFQMMTLRERFAENFQVAYLGFARIDGALLNSSAIKHMKNA